ncbi:MAG: NUDIX domain-containing protein [Draconibacterium sp.]|nr:NUDIX domain-containing protein [Draconibacterium sp.]
MYEVFLNDRKIIIASKREITLNKSTQIIDNLLTQEEVKIWFLQFIKSNIQEVILLNSSPENFFIDIFKNSFLQINAAGGIVIRENRLLFIFRNEKWDLPKGKIDCGETNQEAALREVEEECGISGHKITTQLKSSFHIYKSPYKKTKGEWVFKETFWFEMRYSGKENGTPQTEENITEIEWFSPDELGLPLTNTFANLKSIILLYNKVRD